MDDDATKTFWEARPWTGALIFFGLLIGTGITLSIIIGERPHYRAEWRLVEDAPAQGALVHPEEHGRDPVRVQVLVRAEAKDGAPVFGATAELVQPATGMVISRGLTGTPGGHVLLPVPSRFDVNLFRRELVVLLRHGTGAPRVDMVEPPVKGRCATPFELGKPGRYFIAAGTVTGSDGAPAAGALVHAEILDVDPGRPVATTLPEVAGDDGRFWLTTTSDVGARLRLVAKKDGKVARSTTPLAPGPLAAGLALAAPGTLAGTVLLDGEAKDASLYLVSPEGSELAILRDGGRLGPLPTATFTVTELPPGPYDLVLRIDTRPPLRLAGVVVAPGETTRDPRLSPWDTRPTAPR